eukprot:602025-Rhodomonas_salina.2
MARAAHEVGERVVDRPRGRPEQDGVVAAAKRAGVKFRDFAVLTKYFRGARKFTSQLGPPETEGHVLSGPGSAIPDLSTGHPAACPLSVLDVAQC